MIQVITSYKHNFVLLPCEKKTLVFISMAHGRFCDMLVSLSHYQFYLHSSVIRHGYLDLAVYFFSWIYPLGYKEG